MGVLKKINRRMFQFRQGVKGQLTMATTGDDTTYTVGETGTNSDERKGGNTRQFTDEPLSPHHGVIFTTTTLQRSGSPTFFADDDLQGLDDDDETAMGALILLHFSNVSSSSTTTSLDEGDQVLDLPSTKFPSKEGRHFGKEQRSVETVGNEAVFEPSFEVALMDSNSPAPPLLKSGWNKKSNPLVKPSVVTSNLTSDSNPTSIAKIVAKASASPKYEGVANVPVSHGSLKPERRLDQHGRPFVHIYTEGLSTLYESDESSHTHPDFASETMDSNESSVDGVQMQAKDVVARDLIDNEINNNNNAGESFVTFPKGRLWFGNYISSQKTPRSDYGI